MRRLVFLILGFVIAAPTVLAQTSQSPPAKFKGLVLDVYSARVNWGSMVIEGADRKWNVEIAKDGETVGEINVELPAGKYKFTVEAFGFKPLTVENFCVASGATITYEFHMQVRDCDDCNGELYAPEEPQKVPTAPPPNNHLQMYMR